MKRLLLLFSLFLLVPTLASACYTLTAVVIPCGDCPGQGQLVWYCLGNQSNGAESCNQLCHVTFCEGDDCGGYADQACLSGSCSDSAEVKNEREVDLPQTFVLIPNFEGGYSESAVSQSSCAVRARTNP